jgi:hypothetical protein
MPMADKLPPDGSQIAEREQAHEIDCGGRRLNRARLSSRADAGNSGSARAPTIGHGSHPFPAPGDKPDARHCELRENNFKYPC